MSTYYRDAYRADGWATEIYPMPAFAQLAVADLARSAAWYQQVLGFADVRTFWDAADAPLLVHLRWCTYGDLLLVPGRSDRPERRGVGVTLHLSTGDPDAVAARAAVHGVAPVDGPVDRPWNVREVTFTDPDGYRIAFTGPTAEFHAALVRGDAERMAAVAARLRSASAR